NNVRRSCNDAIAALDIDFGSGGVSAMRVALSDATIGSALRKAGYGSESMSDADVTVAYLGTYYLDFYNEHYANYGGDSRLPRWKIPQWLIWSICSAARTQAWADSTPE